VWYALAVDTRRNTQTIAVVDDDESVRNAVQGVLKSVGMKAQTFASAQEFLDSSLRATTACLITDVQMPGTTGLELQAALTKADDRIPIIFITAYGNTRTRTQAMRAGAIAFLEKPFDDEVLLENVRAALQTTRHL
jgi:two-component system response regulator FixJ